MIPPRVHAAGHGVVPGAAVCLRALLAANGKPSLAQRKAGGAD